ncbi:hypothetical protein F4781DRAFT_445149 [Annulohypoxylon bovei var. microspora]|nr:hypothetical protein F4781DRAFT_445149 [Annulohypoxylon bovei var. microspora]
MVSQPEPLAKATPAPDSPRSPVDGSQRGTSPQSKVTADSSSELTVKEDHEVTEDLVMGNDDLSLQQEEGVNKAPEVDSETLASVTTTTQPDGIDDSSNESPVVGDSTTNQELEMENAPPLRRQSRDSTTLAPILTLFPRTPKRVNDQDDELDEEILTMIREESTRGQASTVPHPSTPSRPDISHSPATSSSTIEAFTMCNNNNNMGEGTASAPKRPHSPTSELDSDLDELVDRMAATVTTDLQRDFVFAQVTAYVTETCQHVLELYGRRLGCKEAFHIAFSPDVAGLRQQVMRPWATLEEIADATEAAVIEAWTQRCQRVITKYRVEMHRKPDDEVRRKAHRGKHEILANAAQVKDTAPPDPLQPRTPSRLFAVPGTPDSKKRRAPSEVEALRASVADLDLNRNRVANNNNNDDARAPPRTPASRKRQRRGLPLPKGYATPRGRRSGLRTVTPTRVARGAFTPTRLPTMTTTVQSPGAYEVVGHIGPYPVMSSSPTNPGFAADAPAEDEDEDGDEDEDMDMDCDGDDVFAARD